MYTPSKPLLSMGSPQRMPFQRPPDFDLAENHVFPRTVGLDTLHYEDEQGENCQSSVYVLPNAPSNLTPSSMIDYGTPSWNPKAWESIVNRSNGAIYEETQPNYSYILPSQGISSTEIPQTTAAVAMNSSDIPGPERTLPTPTTRQQVPNSLNASMFEGLTVPSDFKASGAPPFYPQRTERYTLPSNAPPFTTSPPPKTEAPDLLFPYLTSTTDDTPATSAVISPSYTMESSDFPDVRLRSFREQGQRLLNLSNECMPDVYGYSSSEKKRTDECGATLVSGLPYTRVRHADTPVFPCGLLPEALEFGRPAEMHRPSVEPLGNQGAY
ncbi:hypothetical protein N7532_002387 [Penicillium argentinense]|uniref:Uncharacterized protein n=1 Tax=Penicillium argentinense TaxID=1131581 RepID=A0A9W9KLH4_9EURO|nr:uncharacterized protein N7532_002387 [Penicillium argentinense]KAJ5109742.1 hypothetical protein N7532_002387 [Penicillium argentinense]